MKAVNLLPPDLRSGGKSPAPAVSAGAEAAGGPGAFIAIGALALCVIALAAYVLTTNGVKDREAKLADVTADSVATTREVQALKPYADFANVAQGRVQTVTDLATQRFDWEQSLRDLSRALPADVTLSQLNGSLSSATSTGGGSSSLRSALDVPAIELQGCTSGQSKVATLMSRLRNVDGVTRVSVSKSDKETSTPRSMTAVAAAGTDLGTVGACGRGTNKPTFDLVAFFEGDAAAAVDPTQDAADSSQAPASATPASGDATPTPTPTATPAGGEATTTSATNTNPQGQSK